MQQSHNSRNGALTTDGACESRQFRSWPEVRHANQISILKRFLGKSLQQAVAIVDDIHLGQHYEHRFAFACFTCAWWSKSEPDGSL